MARHLYIELENSEAANLLYDDVVASAPDIDVDANVTLELDIIKVRTADPEYFSDELIAVGVLNPFLHDYHMDD